MPTNQMFGCHRRVVAVVAILLLTQTVTWGQADRPKAPEPTYRDVSYGPHERNVVDFYQAESNSPTPVLVYFHGGGFRNGDKSRINTILHDLCMDAGVSFASANYRLSQHAPYPAQMHDSARAIQFLRSKAAQWNIDSDRIAAFGGSAGAGISFWLAFHDDMADPNSDDPIARQSTRLSCAVGLHAQCTYDPRVIKEIIPGPAYDEGALKPLFGVPATWDWDHETIDDALSQKLIDASPVTHLTDDDPPVFIYHRKQNEVPGDIHHPNFGEYLKKKADAVGVECVRRMSTDFEDFAAQSQAVFEFVVGRFDQGSQRPDPNQQLRLNLRSRVRGDDDGDDVHEVYRSAAWDPKKTALIICDMWDDHTCKGAGKRVAELAPAIEQTVRAAREQGVFIIHAPSDRTSFYDDTPQRQLATNAPFVKAPVELKWNYWNPEIEGKPLGFIQSTACGCETPCKDWVEDESGTRKWTGKEFPWTRQIETITIEPDDAISENGQEIYNLLRQRHIENVILVGVHTNACVCGRPFGLRQMVYLDMNVVLCRDLTDAFFQPKPGTVDQFQGTALVVEHIETTLCPTITSTSLTGAPAFRFREDRQPDVIAIRVDAGKHDRVDAPVSIPLEPLGGSAEGRRLFVRGESGGAAVPTQVENGPEPRLWWVVSGSTKAGQSRVYEWRVVDDTSRSRPSSDGVKVIESDRSLKFQIDEKPVANYASAHVDAPPGVHPSYGRSAHLHPLRTLGGHLVTDELPPDHLHQSGIFFALTRSEFEGREINFWDLRGEKARVNFSKTLASSSGPVFGEFRVEQEHVDLTVEPPKVALRETWDVRAWRPQRPDTNYWIMDIVSTLRCATEHPVTAKKYHYGGMAIRGARQWTPDDCHFVTSNGKSRADGNHTRAHWVDMSGSVNGGQAGVTIMTHPDNFRFPEPVRIHPSMPYMVFTAAVLGDWSIQPGTDHVTRYRYVVHDGPVDASLANRLWDEYAHPCRVSRIP